ncbi:MAG: hypothetical protein LIO46_04560 [Clostridiales bacterium]|nr:hypothetical protein [Clostridiales bacterium]
MPDNKYSIADILREAAELKQKKFGYHEAPAAAPVSKPSTPPQEEKELSTEKQQQVQELLRRALAQADLLEYADEYDLSGRLSAEKTDKPQNPSQGEPPKSKEKKRAATPRPAASARTVESRPAGGETPEEQNAAAAPMKTTPPAPRPAQQAKRTGRASSGYIKGVPDQKEAAYTNEPPASFERPAIIKGETRFEKTADLQDIPAVLPAEALQDAPPDEKTKVVSNLPVREETEEDPVHDGQIRLDGFEPEEGQVPSIEEAQAEQELRERREEKIEQFEIQTGDGKEPDQNEAPSLIEDFTAPGEAEAIELNLLETKGKIRVRSIATGVLGLFMLALSLLDQLDMLPSLLDDPYVIHGMYGFLLVLVFAFNVTTLTNSLRGLFRWKLDFDFPFGIASLFVTAQLVLSFVFPDLFHGQMPVYTLALTTAFLWNNAGKHTLIRRILYNFQTLTQQRNTYTIQEIHDARIAADISRGLLMGDATIKYSVETLFPTRFLELSYQNEPADALAKMMSPILMLASVVIGGATYFLTGDWAGALTAATCAMCISIPVSGLMATNLTLLSTARKIGEDNAMIASFDGAQVMLDTNAVLFDGADLFPAGSCTLHGIKTFDGMRVDDAILHTAAVVIQTKGPLSGVFDQVIDSKTEILPEAESVLYEDRLGISAWIYGKKVLVGNRSLLQHHSVQMPGPEFEEKYAHSGRRLLYLAIAGKIAAAFVVSYSADEAVKEHLQKMEKSGLTLLIKTSDPNIDEESMVEIFDLVEGFVRVMSANAGRIYETYAQETEASAPAYAVHDGTACSFISTLAASAILTANKGLLNLLQIFGRVLGLVLTAVFALFGNIASIDAIQLVLFQCIWSMVVLFVARFRR